MNATIVSGSSVIASPMDHEVQYHILFTGARRAPRTGLAYLPPRRIRELSTRLRCPWFCSVMLVSSHPPHDVQQVFLAVERVVVGPRRAGIVPRTGW